MAESSPDYKLHRLNQPLTKMWLIGGPVRRSMAAALVRNKYRGGCGVCSATNYLMAVVDPRGIVREIPPPLRRFELWQMANAPVPEAGDECPCLGFFDPEVQGEWRERGPLAGHHPLCQWDRTAKKVFTLAQGRAAERVGITIEHGVPVVDGTEKLKGGVPAQARPDEWNRIREEVK